MRDRWWYFSALESAAARGKTTVCGCQQTFNDDDSLKRCGGNKRALQPQGRARSAGALPSAVAGEARIGASDDADVGQLGVATSSSAQTAELRRTSAPIASTRRVFLMIDARMSPIIVALLPGAKVRPPGGPGRILQMRMCVQTAGQYAIPLKSMSYAHRTVHGRRQSVVFTWRRYRTPSFGSSRAH